MTVILSHVIKSVQEKDLEEGREQEKEKDTKDDRGCRKKRGAKIMNTFLKCYAKL